jgi:ATP-binding cassette subfamily F protein 3
LLRATTDQFIIVAEGKLQPFDGDLDDYKDWLFKTKLAEKNAAAKVVDTVVEKPKTVVVAESAAAPADRREQKKLAAEDRQRLSALRKPLENKIKKLEEEMAKRNARKAEVDAKLADSAIYDAANKNELKTLLADQALCVKELEKLEADWLEQHDALEQLSQ